MIGWRDADDRAHRGSLFAAFAALARGEAWSFPALRPHQREPWHAFTVQVAALAMIHAGETGLPTGEEAWRDLLHGLTPDQPEAWELVVEDWSKPALLQPPLVPGNDPAAYKKIFSTPDLLDMLVTSRNHDVKQQQVSSATDEDWLFSLVTLQTTEGFLGAGNYGISRMNGGFASRMTLGIRPTGGAGSAFHRDVDRLVAHANLRLNRRIGTQLLWTVPWDGMTSLNYEELDELYVEVCRRIRLRRNGIGNLVAVGAGSKTARVASGQRKGLTDDPWAPVKADGTASHSPTAAGFGYREMARLLDSKRIKRPLLAERFEQDDVSGLSIVAAALVRGEGKTEGLHRRAVRISRISELPTGDKGALDRIGEVANTRANEAGEAGANLRRALISLVQGGTEKMRLDDDAAKKKVKSWIDQFDQTVDAEFFDRPFWDEISMATAGQNHRLLWRHRLRAIATDIFERAARWAPGTEVTRVRAYAQARSYLAGQMRKWVEKAEHGD
ncbi:MAG: hypothetical protein PGN23_13855 [Sphingomonas adhaesiva]|uniref:hypothetical protein n=1 Tax=Sphingomonas adhaesiva TaxID=28212 RepID=UPI002FFA82AA